MKNEKVEMVGTRQAYEWVKTGYWTLKQFQEWHSLVVKAVAKTTKDAIDMERRIEEESN